MNFTASLTRRFKVCIAVFFLILGFLKVSSAQTFTTGTQIKFAATLPAGCDDDDKSEAIIYKKGGGLYKCVSGLYVRAAKGDGGVTGLANVRVANDFPGNDLGAKINAADKACGLNAPCEIWVFGDGNISTQVVISSNHDLRKFAGTIQLQDVKTDAPHILLKDDTNLICNGWNSIFVEQSTPQANVNNARYRIIGTYNQTLPDNTAKTGRYNTNPARNVHVSGCQFLGREENTSDSGVAATISLGNCYGCSVKNNYFNNTTAYAAQFGGDAASGFTSQDGWFTDNLIENVLTQNVAVVTGENIHIERNTFKNPGKRAHKIINATNTNPVVITTEVANSLVNQMVVIKGVEGNTAANGLYQATRINARQFSIPVAGNGVYKANTGKAKVKSQYGVAVDIEPNGNNAPNGERIRNISIQNNIFDFRDTALSFGAIFYQITAPGLKNDASIIAGNIMLGTDVDNGGSLTQGISFGDHRNAHDVLITGNFIKNATQVGILLSGDKITCSNNTIVNSGGGGSGSLQAQYLTNSTITGNSITGVGIYEKGINSNNYFAGNKAGDQINHYAGAVVTNSTYLNNYVVGAAYDGIAENANSNNNVFDGNITRAPTEPRQPHSFGLVKLGADSKIISHKYTDGRIFMPNLIRTNPIP